MKFTNQMVAQIHRWVAADRVCVGLARQITAWETQRRTGLETRRVAEGKLLATCEREVKRVNYRLALVEQRRRQTELFATCRLGQRKIRREQVRSARQLAGAIGRTQLKLGKRQGHLRHLYQERFVNLAQREQNRVARQRP